MTSHCVENRPVTENSEGNFSRVNILEKVNKVGFIATFAVVETNILRGFKSDDIIFNVLAFENVFSCF